MHLIAKALGISACALLLQGCGGGGSGSGPTTNGNNAAGGSTPINSGGPTVTITSPPAGSMASSNQVTLSGTASDADGVDSVQIDNISATSNDGFATWTADVAINEGINRITASATDSLGNRNANAASISIERGYLFDNARSVVLDPSRNRAILIDTNDSTLKVVDSANQMRQMFSSDTVGNGPSFNRPTRLFLDEESNRAIVFDSGLGALLAVDLTTGDRSVISSDEEGAGASLIGSIVAAMDPARPFLYALSDTQLITVDLNSGNRSAIPLSGTFINDPRLSRVDLDNNRLLVSAATNIFAVNLRTGERSALVGSN
ncbi:MAG: Ig-like domain-containing protein [Pseudomonadales bacterium]